MGVTLKVVIVGWEYSQLYFRDLVVKPLPEHHCAWPWELLNSVLWLHYFLFTEVYITLEHRISKYEAHLFEELRQLQRSSDDQDTPHHSASVEYTPSWATQTFTSGKHYWEMDVGNSCHWIIGLCKESWARRKDMRLSSEGIFLLLCVKADEHFTLFSTSPLIRQYIQRPQGWVGVFLDYECGIVSFVDVAKSSLICSFLSCSFSFPLRPFICYGPKWSETGPRPDRGLGNSNSWGGLYPGDFLNGANQLYLIAFNFILPSGDIVVLFFKVVYFFLSMDICFSILLK